MLSRSLCVRLLGCRLAAGPRRPQRHSPSSRPWSAPSSARRPLGRHAPAPPARLKPPELLANCRTRCSAPAWKTCRSRARTGFTPPREHDHEAAGSVPGVGLCREARTAHGCRRRQVVARSGLRGWLWPQTPACKQRWRMWTRSTLGCLKLSPRERGPCTRGRGTARARLSAGGGHSQEVLALTAAGEWRQTRVRRCASSGCGRCDPGALGRVSGRRR